MTPVISVENVSFAFPGASKVLENVSFQLQAGEFIGLIGPNGGGKTTLLKNIIGFLGNYQGKIEILGMNPKAKQARQKMGYVPQVASFPKDFPATVEDIILMGIYGRNPFVFFQSKKFRSELAKITEFLGLEKTLSKPIGEISRGQLRKVLLARALLREPDVLILDEPLAGVDSSGHIRFFEIIHDLQKSKGLSILMSSHHVESLRRHADAIVCLNRKVHFCNSADLITDKLITHTYECELEKFYHNRYFHILPDEKHSCQEENAS